MTVATRTTQTSAARSGEWMEDPGFGVYVHVPFCLHRCHYCDFNAYEGQGDLHDGYVDAMVRTIDRWRGPVRRATSVFFGGGTPSVLSPAQLRRVLRAVTALTDIEADAEVTIEINPETVDETSFEAMLDAGFNRFSVGVQSLAPHVLRGLGRLHPPDVAITALRAARAAGVMDLNVDLIYGSPWETDDDLRSSLDGVLAFAPEHVSAYALTVEEGTPLATLVATGRIRDVDNDLQASRYEITARTLKAAGYARYEVSNYGLPGRASRHNVLYWSAGDYLGFGAGAHGHAAGRRWWNARLPRDFIGAAQSGASEEAGSESLTGDERVGEALMLGLRLSSGIHLDGFRRRFGIHSLDSRGRTIADLVARGLLQRSGPHLRLTEGATLLANEALSALL